MCIVVMLGPQNFHIARQRLDPLLCLVAEQSLNKALLSVLYLIGIHSSHQFSQILTSLEQSYTWCDLKAIFNLISENSSKLFLQVVPSSD